MNDSHLDPPDHPEPPEWYMTLEDALEDEHMPKTVKTAVQKVMEDWCNEQNEYDPGPEPDFSDADYQNHYAVQTRKCPHGRDHGHCDACDYAGDLAYDAARESRFSQ